MSTWHRRAHLEALRQAPFAAPPEDDMAAGITAPAPSPELPPTSPFYDPAAHVLESDQTLTDETRADIWDHFAVSKSPADLTALLP